VNYHSTNIPNKYLIIIIPAISVIICSITFLKFFVLCSSGSRSVVAMYKNPPAAIAIM